MVLSEDWVLSSQFEVPVEFYKCKKEQNDKEKKTSGRLLIKLSKPKVNFFYI